VGAYAKSPTTSPATAPVTLAHAAPTIAQRAGAGRRRNHNAIAVIAHCCLSFRPCVVPAPFCDGEHRPGQVRALAEGAPPTARTLMATPLEAVGPCTLSCSHTTEYLSDYCSPHAYRARRLPYSRGPVRALRPRGHPPRRVAAIERTGRLSVQRLPGGATGMEAEAQRQTRAKWHWSWSWSRRSPVTSPRASTSRRPGPGLSRSHNSTS
jgi:hypothetical protein